MNKYTKKIIELSLGAFVVSASFFAGLYVNAEHLAGSVFKIETSSVNAVLNKDVGQPSTIDFSEFWKVWKTLDQKFVYTATSSVDEINLKTKLYGAIRGLTDSLGDPYTVFLTPDENNDLVTELAGSLEGVGMEVGIKDNSLIVVAPLKGSPAEKAGVLAGDKILKINDTAVIGLDISAAVKLIRGKKGTPVKLTLERASESEPVVLTIIRDVIKIPIVDIEKNDTEKTFIIKIHSFSANVAELFKGALKEYVDSGYNKLIIDLRNNPGGYLDPAVDIASWFLPSGKTVVLEDFGANKPSEAYRSVGYDIFKNSKLKLVILVNEGSASASEILAGALREHKVGVLVGEKTFGKGSVQEIVPISKDGAALKVTIARWLTPNGFSISKQGITPDFVVKMTPEDVKAKKDPQLEKAFQVLNSL